MSNPKLSFAPGFLLIVIGQGFSQKYFGDEPEEGRQLGGRTASVASWLIEQVTTETAAEVEAADAPMLAELARLSAQVERLTAALAAQPAEIPPKP